MTLWPTSTHFPPLRHTILLPFGVYIYIYVYICMIHISGGGGGGMMHLICDKSSIRPRHFIDHSAIGDRHNIRRTLVRLRHGFVHQSFDGSMDECRVMVTNVVDSICIYAQRGGHAIRVAFIVVLPLSVI